MREAFFVFRMAWLFGKRSNRKGRGEADYCQGA